MKTNIKKIFFNNQENYIFDNKESISKLSRLNIFIGANNSGKSRFLRKIFNERENEIFPGYFELDEINMKIKELNSIKDKIFAQNRIEIFLGANGIRIQKDTNVIEPIQKVRIDHNQRHILEKYSQLSSLSSAPNGQFKAERGYSANPDTMAMLNPIIEHINSVQESVKGNFPEKPREFKYLYIPVLRGLRPIQFEGNNAKYHDSYLQRSIIDYFDNKREVDVFTGLSFYEELKDHLLSKREKRDIIKEFEDYLSDTFFEKRVTLTPDQKTNLVRIEIGEDEKLIHDLGDGIQQIIILTFRLFLNQNSNLLVFIEEPEIYLHPGLQRILVETLMDKRFPNFQYFITTHSNNLLDLTLDHQNISIYTFSRKETNHENPDFKIENVKSGDSRILDLLGVKNSSIFLANCTIWVEGITDRLYIKKYLDVYFKYLQNNENRNYIEYKEDLHYSFIEYHGSNITHWSFLDDVSEDPTMSVEKICNKIFLITDKDKTSDNGDSKKDHRIKKLEECLGEHFHCLPVIEIENTLSEKVLKNVIANYERCDPHKLDFDHDFTEDHYKTEYLGAFINDKLKNRKRNYSSGSGTISDKGRFCRKALKFIETYEDMSDTAKKLCDKLIKFIKDSNK